MGCAFFLKQPSRVKQLFPYAFGAFLFFFAFTTAHSVGQSFFLEISLKMIFLEIKKNLKKVRKNLGYFKLIQQSFSEIEN